MPDANPSKFLHWRVMAQSWFHSRKALIFLATFLVASVGFFHGLLNGDQWIGLVKWLVPAYMAGNVGDSLVNVLGKKDDSVANS